MGLAEGKGAFLRAVLLACLTLPLAVSQAQASPAWLPATDLSAPGRDASNAVVAMGEGGETVALWERQDGIAHDVQASTRGPGTGFSTPLELSPDSSEPQIAMTPGGEALAAWRHFDGTDYVIQVATAAPGGAFSAPVDVSSIETTAAPQELQLATNAAGEAALVWRQKDPGSSVDPNQFSVLASLRPPGGSFSAPAIVSAQPLTLGNQAEGPRVAIDSAGDVSVVWDYFDGTSRVIQAATRPAAGGFSAPVSLTADGQDASAPAVAMDSAGDAIALWARSDGTNIRVEARTAPAGGPFEPPVELSEAGENAGSPQIAMAPDGAATAAWLRKNGGESWIVQAARGSAAHGFSAPLDLSEAGQNAFDPSLSINAAGGAAVVWKRFDASNYIAQGSIAPAEGAFSAPADLSAPGEDAVGPNAAMDGGGDATAVWSRSDGSNRIAQAAGYDADPPRLRSLSIPSTGMAGIPLSFSADPVDVWPIASVSFDFGDGATAAGSSVSHTYAAAGTYRVIVTAADAAGTTASGQGTVAIAPSNRFRIVRLWRNRRRGSATFYIDVPGPGRLVLSGRNARRAVKRPRRAWRVRLPVIARGSALRRLRHHGRAKLAVTVAFTPDGGAKLVKHERIGLFKWLR